MSDVFVRPRSVKISMSEAISMATIPILKHTMEKMTKQLYAEFEKKQKETK